MKFFRLFLLSLLFSTLFFILKPAFAEDKNFTTWTTSGVIPKLPKTPNDPELFNNSVYPMWGPVCQRYTYTVTYKDKEGRKPQYMRIIFNGQSIEMQKLNPKDENYKNGVQYVYKFVPNKLGSNFYYFEASNGLGKARASIIDSPDNGPVLFDSDFLYNEIALIDVKTGKKISSFETKEEWVGGVALSNDGKYLAAKTSKHIYLFETENPKEPKWTYTHDQTNEIGGDLKGGVDISGDGAKIIASIGSSILSFDKSSNKPLWQHNMEGNAYNVAISKDGKYMAAATGGTESNVKTNLLILWNDQSEKPLWQYHSSGNFHDASLSDDGKFIAGATGCPDRRFYLFSRDSNTPLIKSEMLTRDSPVHRAKISSDGSKVAVGSESDAGAVFLFNKNAKEPIWKFPTPNGSSVRALNFTPSGKYIGASTFGGQAYIFDNNKSQPVANWTINAALGGIDISDDGEFIVVGGTDKKAHILTKGSQTDIEISFNEYVEEVDISGNGKYVAVGTGGSVYFFESINKDENKIFPCTTIMEAKPMTQMMGGGGTTSYCGDNKCEGPENLDNCKNDCDSNLQKSGKPSFSLEKEERLPIFILGFAFLISTLALISYFVLFKFHFFKKTPLPENLLKINKKLVLILSILSLVFLLLFTVSFFFINKPESEPILKNTEQAKPEPGKVIMNQEKEGKINQGETKSGCGNTICESIAGETKETCPKDCSTKD